MTKCCRWILFVSAALILAGCNSTGCLDNGTSLPLARFYSSTTLQNISVNILEIRGIGAPNDSVLLSPGNNSEVYLPMDPAADAVTWKLSYLEEQYEDAGVVDYVTFRYRSFPYFASEACGAMYAYRVTGVEYSNMLIDSVGIVDSLFTNTERERIKIFFRTAAGEGGGQ